MDSFDDSTVIPSNLRLYLHRLAENSQPSLNVLKLNAMNSTTAQQNSMITVRLPMALVNLDTFAMHFSTAVTNATTAAGTLPTSLPKGIENIISRLEISANGMSLLNLQNYGLLFDTLKNSHMDLDKSMARRVLQNEVDIAPVYEGTVNTPLGSGQVVHVASIANATVVSDTSITFDCICSTLYPNINEGVEGVENVGPFNLTSLGFPAAAQTAVTGAWITNVTSVPAYTYNGGAAPLVTKFRMNLKATSGFTAAGVGSANNAGILGGFSVYVNSAVINSTTALQASPISWATTLSAPGTAPCYYSSTNGHHTISEWLGFMKSSPQWLQLQAIGEIEIRITLYGGEILSYPPSSLTNGALTTPGTYSLSNIYFTIRTCSFDTDVYDSILSEKLASGGIIEVPYQNAYNISQVQSAGASSTRFSINSQCLEKCIGINRASYYNTVQGQLMSIPAGFGVNSYGTVGLVHKGAFFATYEGGGCYPYTGGAVSNANTYQWQINSQFIPNLPVQPETAYFFNLEAYSMQNDWSSSTIAGSQTIYMASSYQMMAALDFMDPDTKHALFGVDTRGAVSVAYLLQNNNNAGDRTDIFTMFKSVLRIGANQQIQVVW